MNVLMISPGFPNEMPMFTRALLWLFALVHVVRFTVPAFVGGSAGGPFGDPWLTDPTAGTLLLDSDLHYWGVLCAVVGSVARPSTCQPIERRRASSGASQNWSAG